MAGELINPDQYPNIKWSRGYTHEDGDPASTYGVIQITVGARDVLMTSDHLLSITEVTRPLVHSRIRFGYLGHPTFTLRSAADTPFDLEDPTRIQESVETVGNVLTTLHQIEAAAKIDDIGQHLIHTLTGTVGFASRELLEDIGVIEELVKKYRQGISTERLLTQTRRLQNLKVHLFYEGSSTMQNGIIWTTGHLIQYYETGHCPPLTVDEYLY